MTIDYHDIRGSIKNGDILSCRGQWFFSKLIRVCTREYFSHVGIAMWLRFEFEEYDKLCIFESMEGYGVRIQPISRVLREYNASGGEMFWQPIREDLYPDFSREKMLGFALQHWMDKYPPIYQFIVGVSPGLQRIRHLVGKSLDVSPGKRHCSELVADSIKHAGFYNAKESALTTPGDISRYALLGRPEKILYRPDRGEVGPATTKSDVCPVATNRLHSVLRHQLKDSRLRDGISGS